MALRVEHLKKQFGGRVVVDGVSLEVHPGSVTGLLGPSGAGKTTVFRMVAGLIAQDAGQVWLDDRLLGGQPLDQRVRLGLAYLPQEPSILRGLTTRQNLDLVCELVSRPRAEAERLLEAFDLGRVRDSRADHLSGGERRRLEIARCLLAEPRYLLLDEPFTGLDPKAVHDVRERLRGLRNAGLGVLLTDHNVRETLPLLDVTYVVHEGRVLAEGTPETVAATPVVRQAYLGEDFQC